MKRYNVDSPSKAIRKAVEDAIQAEEFRQLHPPPPLLSPRVKKEEEKVALGDLAEAVEERWKEKIPTHCSIHNVKLYVDSDSRVCWRCSGRGGPFED